MKVVLAESFARTVEDLQAIGRHQSCSDDENVEGSLPTCGQEASLAGATEYLPVGEISSLCEVRINSFEIKMGAALIGQLIAALDKVGAGVIFIFIYNSEAGLPHFLAVQHPKYAMEPLENLVLTMFCARMSCYGHK